MNINFKKTGDLEAEVSINITKEDYEPAVESGLKKLQKTANIPGFRPGKAPIGMLKRQYGSSVLVDEINRLSTDALYKYLKDNNIDIVAGPLPKSEKAIDPENPGDLNIDFEIGIMPEISMNIGPDDTLTRYVIEVSDEDIEKDKDYLLERHGTLEEAEVTGERGVIYALVSELDENGEILEGGVNGRKISLTPSIIKDEEVKNSLIGIKKGDKLKIDIRKAFNDNQSVMAKTLEIPVEAANDLSTLFEAEIEEIKDFKPAVESQEFYDRIFGPGVVSNQEEFKLRLKEDAALYYRREAENHLDHMLGHLVYEKHQFDLPVGFIRKWLLANERETFTLENVDEKMANEVNGLRRMIVDGKFKEMYDLEVTEPMIQDAALRYTAGMFQSYGMQNAGYEMVKKFAQDQLKKESFRRQMGDTALQGLIIAKAKELITIREESISKDDFYQMLEAHNHTHQHEHSHEEEHSHE